MTTRALHRQRYRHYVEVATMQGDKPSPYLVWLAWELANDAEQAGQPWVERLGVALAIADPITRPRP